MIEVTLKFSSIKDVVEYFTPNLQGAQPAVASNTGSSSSPPPSAPVPAAVVSNTVSDGTQSAAEKAPVGAAPAAATDKRKPGRPPKAAAAAPNPTPAPAVAHAQEAKVADPVAPEAGTQPTIAKVQEVAQKALERVKARVSADEPNPKAANIAVMAELRETLQKATGVERINLLATPEDMQKAIDALEALK